MHIADIEYDRTTAVSFTSCPTSGPIRIRLSALSSIDKRRRLLSPLDGCSPAFVAGRHACCCGGGGGGRSFAPWSRSVARRPAVHPITGLNWLRLVDGQGGPTNTLRRLSVRPSSRLTRAKPQYFAAKWREERSRTSHYITSHFNTTSPSPTHETTSIMTAMAMVVTIIVRLLASHV